MHWCSDGNSNVRVLDDLFFFELTWSWRRTIHNFQAPDSIRYVYGVVFGHCFVCSRRFANGLDIVLGFYCKKIIAWENCDS